MERYSFSTSATIALIDQINSPECLKADFISNMLIALEEKDVQRVQNYILFLTTLAQFLEACSPLLAVKCYERITVAREIVSHLARTYKS